MDDEDLIRGADAIVLGRITQIESHRDVLGALHTYITVSLDEVFKGDIPGREVTILEIGGTVGDRTYWVFANPEFVVGERVLLFMDQRADGTLRTYHFYLGKFSIVSDPATGDLTAVRGVPRRVTTLPRPSTVAVPAGDVARRLDDFKLHIYQRAGDARPQTLRPRPVLPLVSAAVPTTGTSELRGEFRFIGDPDPPSPVNPALTLVRWIEADVNQPVTLRINSTGEPAAPTLGFSQVRAAMKSWSRVPTSSFRFAEGPMTTTVGFQSGDGISAISFRDPLGEIADPVNCSGILAVAGVSLISGQTTTVNDRIFNRALQGDLVVNNGWEACFGIFYQDIENFTEVITHELGHVLGLGHSEVSTVDPVSGDDGATMEAIAHFDGRAAVLHADDKAGLTFIYPGRTLTIQKTGAGSGTITSGTDGISCGSECVAGFAPDSSVTLTVTPGPGSTFAGFVEVGCGTTVVMSTNRTCTVQFTTDPDLVVSAISGPAVAASGTTIILNNTVRNVGLAAGAFNVGLYLSNSSAVTTLDRQLTTRRVTSGLATNAVSADATSVLIPADVPPGNYFLGAIADIDNEVDEVVGEGNNAASTPVVIAKPDLVVTALTAPATAGAGRQIVVSSTVKNQAAAAVAAQPSTLAFYLSTDAVLGGDVRLTETRAIAALTKDATSVGSTSVTIPANMAAGTYFLIAVADDLHVVAESDETNNTRATATAIVVSRADLTAASVTATPTLTAPGMNVSVSHVVRNAAAAPASAPASTSRLFLSNNTTFGDADDVDLGPVPVAALGAGVQATVVKTVQIPGGTAPGSYWIFARANAGDAIPEATGANNTARTAQPIIVGADLLITTATAAPTSTAPGMTVNVTNTVKNQGGPTTASFDVGIYLSTNTTFGAGADVLLATRRVSGGLAAGALSGPIVTPVVIPSNTSAGAYFLIVRADASGAQPNGEVLEGDETNNVRATAAVQVVRPDLAVLSVQSVTAPGGAAAGMNLSVTHVVKNLAAAAGVAPVTTAKLYLSSDATLDGSDLELGSVDVAPLAGGATATVTKVVTIPGGTQPGSYFVIAQANATHAVLEADSPEQLNNVKATAAPIVIVGPDLIVTAASATPLMTAPGATVNVSNTVRNRGGQATGAFDVSVYLSSNTTYAAGVNRPLASRRLAALGAGAVSGPIVTPIVIPSNTSAGTYFLLVRADSGGEVLEASETNNVLATAAIQVVRPDLTVQSVTAPAVAAAGMNISVSHVVKNLAPAMGGAAASTSRLFLSPDPALDVPGDTVLGDVAVAPLAGGAMATVTKTLLIAGGTAPGLYWVIAQANATNAVPEADSPIQANNVKATAMPIVIGPDLIVMAATVTPLAVAPGITLSVTNTVKNQGGAAAGAFDVGLYLSTNATFEADADTRLATRRVTGLAPSAVSTAATPVTIPTNASGGTYFLIVRADISGGAPQEVVEASETNNALATAAIQVVQPDLSVQSMTAPAVAGPGMNVSVSHVVKNLALVAGGAVASTSRLYLSSDPTLDDPGDVVLGDVAVGPLPGGAMATVTRTVQIPPSTRPGLYWVIAKANVTGVVPEADSPTQANNVKPTATPMIVGPDFLVTAAMATPLAVAPGFGVSLTNTIKNQGGVPAGPFDVGIYLSANDTFEAGADIRLTTRRVLGLTPGAVSTAATPVTIPSNVSAGTYFLIVRADITGSVPQEVAEANEGNNVLATAAVQVVWPDLTVVSVTAPAATAAGMNISVSHVVRNLASTAGAATGSISRLYLSSDPTLDLLPDAVVGEATVGALAGGTSATVVKTVQIPLGTAPGLYWVIARTNATNTVPEVDSPGQVNNVKATATPILVGPDLLVTTATAAPLTTAPGRNVSVTSTVTNQGGAMAGAFDIGFYLSTNTTFEPGTDVWRATRRVAGLAPAAVSMATTAVTIPSNYSAGTYFVIVRADITGGAPQEVAEANEANNARATAPIQVVQPDLSTQTVAATPAVMAVGGNVSVTQTVKNISPPVAGARATTSRLYLSDEPSPVQPTSKPVLGDVAVPPIAGGALVSVTRSLSLPPGTTPGKYWIYAQANAVNPIAESGPPEQINNLQRTAAPIVVGPDLTLTALTVPSLASPNVAMPVVTTVKNQGGQTANASVVRFFLSSSGVLDGTEIPVGVTSTAALAAGASVTTTTRITVPGNTSAGARFLLAQADGDRQVAEADEANNVLFKRFSVVLPDRRIMSLTPPPPTIHGRATSAPDASIRIVDGALYLCGPNVGNNTLSSATRMLVLPYVTKLKTATAGRTLSGAATYPERHHR
ncbi:MAG TPA: CARDB domain-containing protein [Verrucomicrobiae bacterium]|nr:CARDB domain-containing protein [Verrucomicrobiae bacterium]